MKVMFNFRYSTETDDTQLKQKVEAILQKQNLEYELNWRLSGKPFLTPEGELVEAAQSAIREANGIKTALSTSGGTSDGRFIAPTGAQVVELGPRNASIHQINEHVHCSELDHLSTMYERILIHLLTE